jgi:hypothetical protein
MVRERGDLPGTVHLVLPVLLLLAAMAGSPGASAAPLPAPEEAAARLRALLGSPEASAAEGLADRIAALGPAALPALLEEVAVLADDFRRRGTFEAALSAFRRFPAADVRALLLAVTSDGSPPEAAPRALRVLAVLGDGGAAPVTAEICARRGPEALQSPAFRGAVVTALAASFAADGGACAGAEPLFAGGSPEFREAVLDALERVGGPPAVGALLRIHKADPRVGSEAIRRIVRMPVLGVEPEPAGLDHALGVLALDQDPRRRVIFAMAVARLHRVRSLATLFPLLDDEDGEVVRAAERALETMSSLSLRGGAERWEGWHLREAEWREENLPEELDRLDSDDPRAVLRALGSLSRHRLCREKITMRICACLSARDPEVRRAAARALACLGDPRCLGALLTALGDEDEAVRGLAGAALAAVTGLRGLEGPAQWNEALAGTAGGHSRLAEYRRIR